MFDPSKLDISCDEKKLVIDAVVKMLKKAADISNSNIVKNADAVLSKNSSEMEVKWIGHSKQGLANNKYKGSYYYSYYGR